MMKNILLGLLLGLITLAKSQDYKISIEVSGLEDSVAYLGYHFEEKKYVSDTAEIVDDQVTFTGSEQLPPGVYFMYTGTFYHEFILPADKQTFSIYTTKAEPTRDLRVENSPENELFKEFQLHMMESQREIRELSSSLQQKSGQDSIETIENIRKIDQESKTWQRNFIAQHPNSLVSQLMALMLKPEAAEVPAGLSAEETRQFQFNHYRKHYFDDVDFTNPGILRTPVFYRKLNDYIEKTTYQIPDSLIVAADYLLEKSEGNQDVFQFILASLINKYNSSKIMGMDKVFVHLAQNYYLAGKAPWASDKLLKDFSEAVDKLKYNLLGEPAPRLAARDTLLDAFDMRDLNGEYIILYFYSPTCGHCKKKTPEMLDTWRGIADQGVDMLAVNVETDIEEWRKFVREYDMDCINGADPFKQSNFRYEYNVETTPTIYVIDEERKIIAKKLDVSQVEDFILNHKKSQVQ